MIRIATASVLLLLLTLPLFGLAQQHAFFDYYNMGSTFREAGAGPGFLDRIGRIESLVSKNEIAAADNEMSDLLAGMDDEVAPRIHARTLANAAMLKAATGNAAEGVVLLERGVSRIETERGPFDELLIELLTIEGLMAAEFRNFELAKEAFRRAQHITHRHDGVYSRRQLPLVDYLARVHLQQEELWDADQQKRFNLKINEQVYGENSEELLPVLEQLGRYFAERGDTIPLNLTTNDRMFGPAEARVYTQYYRVLLFQESIGLYERAIKIVEDNYGPNDLRLVGPLKGLADARLRQRTSRRYAEDAMERMVQIVNSNPASDVSDRARALVDLGDIYTRTSDSRAEEKYLEAWNLLSQHPELENVKHELFGMPHRIYPERDFIIPLNRLPSAAEGDESAQLFANVEFSVIDDGSVDNVRIVDANVPNEEKNLVRKRVKASRYRPRIVDGKLVETDGLILYQPFKYIPTEPEITLDTSVGPTP